MLNKELLLSGPQEDEWHFEITVGKGIDHYGDVGVGYSEGEFGRINRIPMYDYSSTYSLATIYFRPPGETYLYTTNAETSTSNIPHRIQTSNGKDVYVNGSERGFFDTLDGDVFDLLNNEGKRIGFKIDPPPTGYLDPVTLEPIG